METQLGEHLLSPKLFSPGNFVSLAYVENGLDGLVQDQNLFFREVLLPTVSKSYSKILF